MRRERGEERRSKPLRLTPDHALMTRGLSIRPSLPRRSAKREGGLRNSQNSCLMARVIVAVLLNALVPGAGHATLGRYGAAVGWFVGTVAVYLGGMVALVYAALNIGAFDRLWRLGELRLFAIFLLPGLVVHTWCCVSVLPSAAQRRLAVGCAAAALLALLLVAPNVDLGLRKQMKAIADPAAIR